MRPTFFWEFDQLKTLKEYLIQSSSNNLEEKIMIIIKLLIGLIFLRDRKITLSKFDDSIVLIGNEGEPVIIGYGFPLEDEKEDFKKFKCVCEGILNEEKDVFNEIFSDDINYDEILFHFLLKGDQTVLNELRPYLDPIEVDISQIDQSTRQLFQQKILFMAQKPESKQELNENENENEPKLNENKQKSNENEQKSNENEQKSNENEQKSYENKQKSNENGQKSNENEQKSENERKSNENEQKSNENGQKSNENEQKSENKQKSNENEQKLNENEQKYNKEEQKSIQNIQNGEKNTDIEQNSKQGKEAENENQSGNENEGERFYQISVLYKKGTKIIPQSDRLSLKYLKLSADSGKVAAMYSVYKFLSSTSVCRTPPESEDPILAESEEDRTKIFEEGVRYLKKAADHGHPEAAFEYYSHLLKKSTEEINSNVKCDANDAKGNFKIDIDDDNDDANEIKRYLRIAADGEVLKALSIYGSLLINKDNDSAIEYMRKALNKGDQTVAYELGSLLFDKQYYEEAEKVLRISITKNSSGTKIYDKPNNQHKYEKGNNNDTGNNYNNNNKEEEENDTDNENDNDDEEDDEEDEGENEEIIIENIEGRKSLVKMIEVYKKLNKNYSKLLKALADNGDANAMRDYAQYLLDGIDISESSSTEIFAENSDIVKYLALAIDNGLTDSLGNLFKVVRKVPKFYTKCEQYFLKGIEIAESFPTDEEKKGECFSDFGNIQILKDIDPTEHYQKSYELGNENGLFNLAFYTKSEELLKKSAEKGNTFGMFLLWYFHHSNSEGSNDCYIEYLEKSAAENNPLALCALGLLKINKSKSSQIIKENESKVDKKSEDDNENRNDNDNENRNDNDNENKDKNENKDNNESSNEEDEDKEYIEGQRLLSEAARLTDPLTFSLPFPSALFFDKDFCESCVKYNIKLAADLGQNAHMSFLYAYIVSSMEEKARYYKRAGELGLREGYQKYYKLVQNDDSLFLPDLFEDIAESSDISNFVEFQKELFEIADAGVPEFAQKISINHLNSKKEIYAFVHNLIIAVDCRPYKDKINTFANLATSVHFLILEENLQNLFRDLLIQEVCSKQNKNRARFLFIELCIENFMFSIEYFMNAVKYLKNNNKNNFNKLVELWFPEVRPNIKLNLDYYFGSNGFQDYTLISDEYIKENRKKGNIEDKIAQAIRTDSLVALKKLLIENKKVNVNMKIEQSFFELSDQLDKHPSLLSYAAFFHSIKCFNYLAESSADYTVFDDDCCNVAAYAAAAGDLAVLCRLQAEGELDCQMAAEFAAKFHRGQLVANLIEGRPILFKGLLPEKKELNPSDQNEANQKETVNQNEANQNEANQKETVNQNEANQNEANQNEANQNEANQNEVNQNEANQNEANQNEANQNEVNQNEANQSEANQNEVNQKETYQNELNRINTRSDDVSEGKFADQNGVKKVSFFEKVAELERERIVEEESRHQQQRQQQQRQPRGVPALMQAMDFAPKFCQQPAPSPASQPNLLSLSMKQRAHFNVLRQQQLDILNNNENNNNNDNNDSYKDFPFNFHANNSLNDKNKFVKPPTVIHVDDIKNVIVEGILSDFVEVLKYYSEPEKSTQKKRAKGKIDNIFDINSSDDDNLDNESNDKDKKDDDVNDNENDCEGFPLFDEDGEKSIFYQICERGNTGVLRYFPRALWRRMLIESIQGEGEDTVLTRVSEIGNYDMFSEIIKHKEVRKLANIENRYGQTPVDVASTSKKLDIVEILEFN